MAIQRCVDHASGARKDRLIAQIIENAFFLVQDPYGNYVQYILDLGDPELVPQVYDKFKRNVTRLSKQKFSSNVIEKTFATPFGRGLIHGLVHSLNKGHRLYPEHPCLRLLASAATSSEPEPLRQLP